MSPCKNYRCVDLIFLEKAPSSIQLFCDPLQILLNYVLICLRGNSLLGIRPQYWKLHRVERYSSIHKYTFSTDLFCV